MRSFAVCELDLLVEAIEAGTGDGEDGAFVG